MVAICVPKKKKKKKRPCSFLWPALFSAPSIIDETRAMRLVHTVPVVAPRSPQTKNPRALTPLRQYISSLIWDLLKKECTWIHAIWALYMYFDTFKHHLKSVSLDCKPGVASCFFFFVFFPTCKLRRHSFSKSAFSTPSDLGPFSLWPNSVSLLSLPSHLSSS